MAGKHTLCSYNCIMGSLAYGSTGDKKVVTSVDNSTTRSCEALQPSSLYLTVSRDETGTHLCLACLGKQPQKK